MLDPRCRICPTSRHFGIPGNPVCTVLGETSRSCKCKAGACIDDIARISLSILIYNERTRAKTKKKL